MRRDVDQQAQRQGRAGPHRVHHIFGIAEGTSAPVREVHEDLTRLVHGTGGQEDPQRGRPAEQCNGIGPVVPHRDLLKGEHNGMAQLRQQQQQRTRQVQLVLPLAFLSALALRNGGQQQGPRDHQQRAPLGQVQATAQQHHRHQGHEDSFGTLEDHENGGGRPIQQTQAAQRRHHHLEDGEGNHQDPWHHLAVHGRGDLRLILTNLLVLPLLFQCVVHWGKHHFQQEDGHGQRQGIGELVGMAMVPAPHCLHVEETALGFRHQHSQHRDHHDDLGDEPLFLSIIFQASHQLGILVPPQRVPSHLHHGHNASRLAPVER